MTRALLMLFFILTGSTLGAQIRPQNNDTVNYRLVGFSVPENKNASSYTLEVHEYFIKDDGDLYTNLLFEKNNESNSMPTMLPAFGKSYKWRVKYKNKDKVIDSTAYNILTIGYSKFTDTNKYRMRVLKNEVGNHDYFIFVDGTRTLYDMDGNAIWFLPNIAGVVDDNSLVRDIEVTPFNTITFITNRDACEIDYDGNILWRAPDDGEVSKDSTENYHHELTRLNNGNYMVAGVRHVNRRVPEGTKLPPNTTNFFSKDGQLYKEILFATIIEYDSNGKIVWSWLSEDHFTDADIYTLALGGKSLRSNTHMNAFFFNENDKTIYTSHRNINRIVKIAYPSGKVLASYGEAYNKEIEISGDGMFYGQHNCKLSMGGDMYLFNNNNNLGDSNSSKISTVAFFKEPQFQSDTLKKVWEFSCKIDSITNGFTPGGGGVFELNSGDLLVCMAICRNFIVTKSKNIIWDSIIEHYDENNNPKVFGIGYRSNMIEHRKHLVDIIYK